MIWRGMKILSIFWGGGKTKLDSFWGVIAMQFWVLSYVQCTKYRMGIVLGLLKFHFYLSLNRKCDKFDMLIIKPCTDGSTGFPRPWRITKGLEVRFEGTSLLPFYCKKQASIIRKYHDQTLNTVGLIIQIINPTRPGPAVENNGFCSAYAKLLYARVILNGNTKTCEGGDFNFVFFLMEMFIASLPMV